MLSVAKYELASDLRTMKSFVNAEPLESRVLARLQRSPYLALRRLSCKLQDGVLTLHGRVPTNYLKQVAQAAVCTLDGLPNLRNDVEVITA